MDYSESIVCPRCHKKLYLPENHTITTGERTITKGLLVDVGVRPSCHRYLDEDVVRRATWWHASSGETWPTPSEHFVAHLGTYNAAKTMARWDCRDTLNAVRLKPEVSIAPEFLQDLSSWRLDPYVPQVYRYINAWESMGSISLLAPTSAFEVVDRFAHRLHPKKI